MAAWTTASLLAVLAAAEQKLIGQSVADVFQALGKPVTPAMHVARVGGDTEAALAVFEHAFAAGLHAEGLDTTTRDALAEVLNRWGLLLQRTGSSGAAVEVFSWALSVASPNTEQAIRYNRGYARLKASVRDLETGNMRAVTTVRATIAMWRAVVRDMDRAVALKPDDDAAWAHLGHAHMLLAAAGLTMWRRTRRAHAATALTCFENALMRLPTEQEHHRPALVHNCARVKLVIRRLAQLPWWSRLAGGMEVSLELA